ncbi:probable guanine nucleotide exchange factor MCF2L2 [Pelobates cultripes]|uniref:Probable guanine nucleotide exchange factor MCF2L2 n=1 Tax=Pelobates cultripes TaxID=61616 RepID=A0AAD1RBX1_PELCU|nr:probable guanine nucleotide exchange factor MCF2L2 [Pelobates cultripes]
MDQLLGNRSQPTYNGSINGWCFFPYLGCSPADIFIDPSTVASRNTESKEKEVTRRFSLASSMSTTAIKVSARTKGWPRHMNSLETYEDFSTIPSSNDELSNSDAEEEAANSKESRLFCVRSCFETCSPATFTLQPGDIVQFQQCGENGQWLVKELVSKKSAWVPSSLLNPAKGDMETICQKDNSAVYSATCQMTMESTSLKEKQNERTRSLVVEQKALS